ncbi:siderophore iron transporter-like protein mirB [Dothidotthia symphoricarpi CBS 119687]|uniref:Siderophore iron transporter-like protein mirB n=1 Tax=Dothidotthia symphoricarpi CBS 119687 TaxID=1392245 RepID=A0A6A5ZYQ9_9PLEO|nr:siderophore iron transporter-like protein mirB [Dothidotthia symphoricarpi CBS 119687]KAF2124426.1 siderophore iron transporter-like protein mirB [Dothidotthia symphoricarpi CBS 119687]
MRFGGAAGPTIRYSVEENADTEKQNQQNFNSAEYNKEDSSDANSEEFQAGVERVRAITAIWTKKTLFSMFCLLYLIDFVEFLQNSVDTALNPYITSSFSSHGLLTVSNVMATALSGCIPLATAKIVDIWGRVEGFMAMLLIVLVGMIMKAVCRNVETYFAAHVLYWAGHIGLLYVTSVMCSDLTTLKNRMIIITINSTPRIAATFAGPAIGELFYTQSNFRWAFGAFAIILFGCSMPAMGLMFVMYRKALKAGLRRKQRSDRNIFQSLWYYFVQFDVVGMLLLMFGFCLFMLPFTLVSYAPNGWNTGYIIAMIVIGVLLFPAFFVWEKFFAPVQFMPWIYLKDRTIVGSCLLYGVMFISVFTWNGFYYSYLLVVHRQSITHAGYILNSFSLASSLFSPFVAWIISYTGNFKWTCYTGVPIMLLGTALLIPFRQPSTNPGVLALTQVLVGLGTGIFATCAQLAVMVPVTHQQVASALAFWGLFGSFGSSIGYSIAGAIWNNVMPAQLYNRLPEESKSRAAEIFSDIVIQSSFLDGTPERDAIVGAYAHAQRLMVITGSCFVPLCFASILIWKNINIKKLEEEKGRQTRGTVF